MHALLIAAAVASSGAARGDDGAGLCVVELFTSQGCSSCPPAEAELRRLNARPGVVALEFHVDYWDRLGWPDPWGDPAYTRRQRRYSASIARGRTYTPQMVVNGRLEFVGSDRARIDRALAEDCKEPGGALRIDAAAVAGADAISVRTDPSATWAALVQDGLVTRVPRGENAGRTLRHDAVVRALVRLDSKGAGRLLGAPASAGPSRVVAWREAVTGAITAAAAVSAPSRTASRTPATSATPGAGRGSGGSETTGRGRPVR